MLQQRIETRMVEGGTLDCEVLERRLETARIELDTLINSKVVGAIDYLIVNDNLEKACSEVVQTVDVERRRVSRFDPTALQQQFVDT